MHFLYQPQRFWTRPGTHTVVSDRDPRFAHFATGADGEVKTYLRVWLGRWGHLPRYLGGVWVRARGPLAKELALLEHRMLRCAGQEPAPRLRRTLTRQLARFTNERLDDRR